MRGFNFVSLIGNAGKDPETRYSQSGSAVCSLSLAVSEKYGEKETTEWVNLVAFGKTAEILGQYVTKGSPLHVTGRLQTRSWEKDGQKRYTTEVVVDRITLLGGKA